MKQKWGWLRLVIWYALACQVHQMSASMLALCGVADQSIADLDPTPGIVRVVNCTANVGGTGTFSGSAQELVTSTMDTIHIFDGTYTGAGTLSISNQYNFPAGTGPEISSFAGRLEAALAASSGGGFLNQSALASTFRGPAAIANFTGPAAGTSLPFPVVASQTLLGMYAPGPGVLTGTVNWNAGAAGQQFRFVGSQDFVAAVPEPDISILLGFGCLALIAYGRHRSKTRFRG